MAKRAAAYVANGEKRCKADKFADWIGAKLEALHMVTKYAETLKDGATISHIGYHDFISADHSISGEYNSRDGAVSFFREVAGNNENQNVIFEVPPFTKEHLLKMVDATRAALVEKSANLASEGKQPSAAPDKGGGQLQHILELENSKNLELVALPTMERRSRKNFRISSPNFCLRYKSLIRIYKTKLLICATISGLSKVDTSPKSSSLATIFFKIRRIIFPDLVFGKSATT
jgi:hypothetical protein